MGTQALRPVTIALGLLLVLVYVFGIAFRSQVDPGSELESMYFSSVTHSMWTLLLHGTLMDAVSVIANNILEKSGRFLAGLFLLYILLSSFTVLNMLIGVVCEMVANVRQAEDERMAKNLLTSSLMDVMLVYDLDGDESLHRSEFELFIQNPEVYDVLLQFGVDVDGLQTLVEVLFQDAKIKASKNDAIVKQNYKDETLTFNEILDLVVRLRGGNTPSVTDIVQLREYTKQRLDKIETSIAKGHETLLATVSLSH